MAGKGDVLRKRSPECKYLGRIVLDGPTNARPHKTALQAMIDTIERHAPARNKRRLHFEVQTLRPVIPDNREKVDRQTKDTLVAFDPKGVELFRVAFTDVVSVGSCKRNFVFITLDEHGISTPQKSPAKIREGHGKFYVQAFRFSSVGEASNVSQNLIRAVEASRIKDMQLKLKKAHAHNCWTATATEADRALVEERTGRNPLMSPLPQEVPPHLAPELRPERPPMCSPLVEAQPEAVAVPADREDIQRTLDSHDLSPQQGPVPVVPLKPRRNRPTHQRAVEMQHHYGAAIVQASDESSESSSVEGSPDARLSQAIVAGQTAESSERGFNLVTHDHALRPHLTVPEAGGHRTKTRSALSESPAESGYTSEGGSNVSLLSAKSVSDEGLTPSPLASKGGSTTSAARKDSASVRINLLPNDSPKAVSYV